MDLDPESDPDPKADRHQNRKLEDPDPDWHQNVADAQHCRAACIYCPLSQLKRRPVAARDWRIPRTNNPGGLHRLQSLDDLSEGFDR
jgi:hypothetical protein